MQTGCRCRECFGLAEFMESIGRSSRDLPRAPGHDRAVLRVVTRDDVPAAEHVVCSGSMTCSCESCVADRAARVKRGVRPTASLPIKHAA